MRIFCLVVVVWLCVMGAGEAAPWPDGERLRYRISWGIIPAAEADFQAGKKREVWHLALDLRSVGLVAELYPLESRFTGTLMDEVWLARRFEVDRRENGRHRSQVISMNPLRKSAAFTDRISGETVRFSLPSEDCQHLLSVLYTARTVMWKPGVERFWDVCDRDRLKRVRVRCMGMERGPGARPDTPLRLVLNAEEVPNALGQAPRKPMRARIWLNPVGMVPEAADLQAIFGTFHLRRISSEEPAHKLPAGSRPRPASR